MHRLLFLLATPLLVLGVVAPASAVTVAVGTSTLDGVLLTAVPTDVGPLVSDVRATLEDVATTARVWESGPGTDGRYRVDLTVTVLRGLQLTDPEAVHRFLADYLGRHDAAWARVPYAHLDGPGYRDGYRAFWLVHPGMAVMVRLDPETATIERLVATADGVRVPLAGRAHPVDPATKAAARSPQRTAVPWW
ncbi:MAG: hypothetical protein ABI181_09620 [Mycobacteriaceae bacterium]